MTEQDIFNDTSKKVRSLDPENVSGHSTLDGLMLIGVPMGRVSDIKSGMDKAFSDAQIVAWSGVGYGAIVEEKEYGYANTLERGPSAQQSPVERDVNLWKAEAERIFAAGVGAKLSLSRSDAAGSGRDRGVSETGSATPGYGRGTEGSVSVIGQHWSHIQEIAQRVAG
jgi:hypothetical protein